MAGARIRGITIELGADASKLEKALSDVSKNLKTTQSDLKDVNKLLKFDPKSTELLAQKQKLLKKAIDQTEDKLSKLKDAQKNVAEGSREWDAIQREIIDTEKSLDDLKKAYKDFGSVTIQQIKAVGQEMQEAGEKITDFGQKLAPISAAAGALGAGLLKLGYDAVTGADDLNTLAKQTGLSTSEIQKLQYASDLIDVSFEDVAGALTKMKKNMTGHAETWEKLGVSVTNADGTMRDAKGVFYDAVKALSEVENETERDQLAMDLFGKSADSLAGIVDDGGQSLREFGDKAEEMGLILSQDTLDSLNDVNDTIDELKANFSATAGAIGADVATVLAPALEILSEKAQVLTEFLRNLTPEQTAVILAITGLVAVLAPLILLVGGLVGSIGAIITVAAPVIAAIGGLGIAFFGIVAAVAAVKIALLLLIKNWDKVKEKAAEIRDGIVNKFNEIKTNVINSINLSVQTVLQKWETLKTTISTAAENIRTTVKTKFEQVKTAITDPIDKAKTAVSDAITKIKNIVNNAKLSLPHIKLPHFKIKGGQVPWGIGGVGTPPSISIDWYKKAHSNAVVFTSPTVLPTLNGFKGFGDGGAEVVMDYNKLAEMTGNVYITVNAAPGMDVNQLVDAVQRRLAAAERSRNAVFA